jgi:hypothetical protein
MAYEDETADELRGRLRERDLMVSGSKEDLIARLQEADARGSSPAGGRDGTPGLGEVVDRIRREFAEITGLEPERTTGLETTEDGWRARIDVVEVSRVPRATDVLGVYEVLTDADGALRSFDRTHRYRRSEAGTT